MTGAAATRFRGLLRAPLVLSFGSSMGIQGLNAVTGVLLARGLEPSQRGQLAASMLWPGLLSTVGALGVAEASTFHVARRPELAGTVLGSAAVIWVAQSLLLVGAGALLIPHVLGRYGTEGIHTGLIALGFIPLSMIAIVFGAVLNGLERFRLVNLIRILVVLVAAVVIILLAAAGSLSTRGAVIAYVGANGAAAIVGVVALWRVARTARSERETMRRLLRYGVRSHTSSATSIVTERLDQLVISLFLAPAKLGLYVVAVTLGSLTSIVGSSIAIVALPRIAQIEAGPAQQRAACRYMQLTVLLSAVITVPLIVLTEPLIDLLFGSDYVGATATARVLLVAAMILATTRTLGTILRAINKPLTGGIGEMLGAAITIAALAVLLPLFGILGAGVASLLAYATSAAFLTWAVSRALHVPPSALLVPRRRVA